MTDTSATAVMRPSRIADTYALLKPRVMYLVVFTAATGMLVAPGQVDGLRMIAIVLLIAMGGGASGALNMWWDADIDALMRRTAARPVPSGRISAATARNLGLVLSAVSVVLLAPVANIAAAALLAFTIFFYAVIYTMWLKRSTPWNIVIGGAAGAFPPMIGWVAVTGNLSIEAFLMFGLTFLWTPPHFWALALFMKDDYSRANVPMLTVTHGRVATRRQILIYSLMLVAISLGLAFSSIGGVLFLGVATAMNLVFVRGAIDLLRRKEADAIADRFATERRYFRLSLSYLFTLFVALLAEAGLHRLGIDTAILTNLAQIGLF